MKLVILESPYSGATDLETQSNIAYARRCLHDCLSRGESPIASHLLFTQPGVLDDTKPVERKLGISAGHAWFRVAEACVVYADRGVSEGMEAGICEAKRFNIPVEVRKLGEAPIGINSKFSVGQNWRMRSGEIVKIVRIDPSYHPWLTVKFLLDAGRQPYLHARTTGLNPDGFWTHLGEHPLDLVEKLTDAEIET